MREPYLPTVEKQHRMEPTKWESLNRQQKRRITIKHGVRGRSQAYGTARVRSGVRTGTTHHFKLWMADLKLKSALQKTSTADLADHTATPSLAASAYALMFIAGIRNVYDLTQAKVEALLQISGIGPKKLEAVESHLKANNVQPGWTVAD